MPNRHTLFRAGQSRAEQSRAGQSRVNYALAVGLLVLNTTFVMDNRRILTGLVCLMRYDTLSCSAVLCA